MESLISNLVQYSVLALTILGVLAFVVSVITQVTKSWGFLNKIPTAAQVYVTSLILTVLTVIIYIQYSNMKLVWYYIIGAILLSFFVSFVVTNGWDQFYALWNRFYKKPGDK